MNIAFFLMGFVGLATIIGILWIKKAPIGYEDERGFHFGWHDGRRDHQRLNPDRMARPAFLQLPWVRPILGMAALFVILLAVSQREEDRNRTSSSEQVISKTGKTENLHTDSQSDIARGESSKLFPVLCRRFSQVE